MWWKHSELTVQILYKSEQVIHGFMARKNGTFSIRILRLLLTPTRWKLKAVATFSLEVIKGSGIVELPRELIEL